MGLFLSGSVPENLINALSYSDGRKQMWVMAQGKECMTQSLSGTKILGLCMQKQEYDGQAVVCTEKEKVTSLEGKESHGHHTEMEQTVRVECTV